MTPIIKAGAVDARIVIKDFGGKRVPAPAPRLVPDPESTAALVEEIVRLKEALASCEGKLANDVKRAAADAFAEGERVGRAAAAKDDERAQRALEDALKGAIERLERQFEDLQSLSGALCRVALADVFSPAEDFHERTIRMLRRQIEALKREAVIRVKVSAKDFGNPAAVDALATSLGVEGMIVETDDALNAGSCRVRLELGQLDLSLSRHWEGLCAVLQTMASDS